MAVRCFLQEKGREGGLWQYVTACTERGEGGLWLVWGRPYLKEK